jgi:hypothetical protein
MSGHRQAAVALHGLTEEDRALILSDLPADDRLTLQGYLRELDELGFEGGPAVVSPAAADGADTLEHAPAAVLATLLAPEPAALIGQFLAIRDWRWRDELLAMLPAPRRMRVRSVMAHGAPAPARCRFLLAAVARRLAIAPHMQQRSSLISHLVRIWNR